MSRVDFIRAILAEPDDDTLRLVYADWLEDHGDPQGELIRVQVAWSKLTVHDDAYWTLKARAGQLLRRYRKGFAGDVRHFAKRCDFSRGMLEEITIRASDFLTHAETLFNAAPIQQVRLIGGGDVIDRLAECPYLEHLRGLDLRHEDLDVKKLDRLLASPYLKNLRSLGLRGTQLCTREGFFYLGACDALGELEELDLSDQQSVPRTEGEPYQSWGSRSENWDQDRSDYGIDSQAMQGLTHSSTLKNLRTLRLRGHGHLIGQQAMDCLLESPLLGRLTELNLIGKWCGYRNLFHKLTCSEQASGLEVLRLCNACEPSWNDPPTPAGSALRNLKELELVGDIAIPPLMGYPCPQLHTLRVNHTRLNLCGSWEAHEASQEVNSLDNCPQIRVLDLDIVWVNRHIIHDLLETELLTQLRSYRFVGKMDCWNRDSEPSIYEPLLESEQLQHLRELTLNCVKLTDSQLDRFLSVVSPEKLVSLSLTHNELSDDCLPGLCQEQTLTQLASVDLRSNAFSSAGKQQLRDRFDADVRYGQGHVYPRDEPTVIDPESYDGEEIDDIPF